MKLPCAATARKYSTCFRSMLPFLAPDQLPTLEWATRIPRIGTSAHAREARSSDGAAHPPRIPRGAQLTGLAMFE
ncbi:hypothetical protein GCM10009854_40440 [Saccharopolyspora halophila]|uniref:Uncharacterized protein n=1 Tax=Saccharopolyspora halophila TaxID=405551 RepID=A0ABP5TR37_9PSEU